MSLSTSHAAGEPILAADVNAIAAAVNAIGARTAADVPFTPTGTIAATNVQDAIVEVASEAGGGGGGGSAAAVYWWRDTTSVTSGAVPVVDTAVPTMSLTIPASATDRTALLSVNLITDGHANRFAVTLDGTLITPSNGMTSQGNDNGKYHLASPDVPIPIPGDSATHVLGLVWQAQSSTSAVNMLHRAMVATVYPGSSSPL